MTSRRDSTRRLGRRIGIGIFAAIVSAFTLVCSVQIILQVWAPNVVPLDVACRPGILALVRAVDRARQAAASEIGDERAALARFRRQLEPEWKGRAAVQKICFGDGPALRALREVDQLRYAEEHGVRYEAVDLAHRRRRIRAINLELGESKITP